MFIAAFCMFGKVEFTIDPERLPPLIVTDLLTGSIGSELDFLELESRLRNPLKRNDFLAIPDVKVYIAPETKFELESFDWALI